MNPIFLEVINVILGDSGDIIPVSKGKKALICNV
jgi:hypothetical protein